MDIDRIIDNVVKEVKEKREKGETPIKSSSDQTQNFKTNYEEMSLFDLCQLEIKGEEEEIEIYKRFLADAENYIDAFTDSPRCKDSNADKGMFKCSHDTWESCIRAFAIDYFRKYKYLHIIRREREEGGIRYDEKLLRIGLEVYETLCTTYRKVVQVYDICQFLGISKDMMYRLSEIQSAFLKKAHSATENSLRIGAVSGRGNVAGNALLLNHDYDYTRTTQIIHTSNNANISAKDLPTLEQTQDIVIDERSKINQIEGNL